MCVHSVWTCELQGTLGRGRGSDLLEFDMWIMWAKLHKVRPCLVITEYNEPI